jgi:Holliday junction resolvase RusA-like endonuclease
MWEQIIYGEAASKANSRRFVSVGGKPRFIKSKKALDYTKEFGLQLKPPSESILDDVEVNIIIWYRTRRPDLDPALIFDLLQPLVIKNDRQIKVIHAYHALDKENPRAWIRILRLSRDFILPF